MITFFTLLLPNASERRPGALGWYESAALLAIAFFAAIGAPESLQFIYFQF